MKFNAQEGAFTPHIWKVMKLMAFLLFIAALQVSARSSAQTITISERHIAVGDLFNRIKQQTGYSFLWDDQLLSRSYTVSVEVKNGTIDDVLRQCLSGLPLIYKIENTIVYILRAEKEKGDPVPIPVTSPPIDIRGRVTDSLGNPLVGASVTVKGVAKGVETDANGMFMLKGITEDVTLVISFTGYATREVKPGGNSMVMVTLPVSTSPLDQVQVIAYGTTTKRLNTGNVTTIKAETLERQPVNNVLGALEGRVPGLFIQQQTGIPGPGAFKMQIRGQSSLNQSSNPLVIVDGIPYNPTVQLNGLTTNNNGTPLSFINIPDIESISVLKDADATAIYGSRGASGVILITTKKGKAGETKIGATFTQGYQVNTFPVTLLNTPQYLQMRHEALKNDGLAPTPGDDPDLVVWDTTRYTNWEKYLAGNTARYTNVTADIKGGSSTIQYLVSGNYHRESTIFPGDFADQKGGLHFNLNTNSRNNRFKMSLTGTFSTDQTNIPQADISGYSTLPPDAPPVYTPTGALNWANSTWPNPVASLHQPALSSVNNLLSSFMLSYEVLPGLQVISSLGYTYTQDYAHSSIPLSAQNPAYNPINSASFLNEINTSFNIEPQITYDKVIGRSVFGVVGGVTLERRNYSGSYISASNYTSDAFLQSPSGASTYYGGSVGGYVFKYAALFGKLTYNYGDKYILSATGNRDGSSKFGPGNQIGNFGSIAGVWIFTKETWLKNTSFLSFGKLRASYGITGNDQIGNYKYLSLYQPGNYPFEGVSGLVPTSLSNPDFSWETKKKLEIGLDLGFFKDRVLFGIDYYRERVSNQLIGEPLPSFVGPGTVQANLPAVIQNKGFDFTLSTVNIQCKDFNWKTNFNTSFNQNKLLAYPGLANSVYAGSYTIGQPVSSGRYYRSAGVNSETGLFQFIDAKGNITDNPSYNTDRTVIVSYLPKYSGGMGNTFNYKSFQLDFFLQFVNQKLQDPYFTGAAPGYSNYNVLTMVLPHVWHKPGDKTRYERLTSSFASTAQRAFSNASISDMAVVSSSYVRLSNASLSYNLPLNRIRALHLSAARIYVQGQNLYTFTSFHSDPEIPNYSNTTPIVRTIVAGAELNF